MPLGKTFSYEPETAEEVSLALVLLSAIEAEYPARQMAADMLRRFATAPRGYPSLQQWTMRVLNGASKAPGPFGLYATLVAAEIIRQQGN